MWHIPINAGERSLLHAAETFGQFEGLLQFFERLDNEESDAWWDELAGKPRISDESDLKQRPSDDSCIAEHEQPNAPAEAIVMMQTTTANNLGIEASFEIEQDMRILLKATKTGKVSVQDYVEAIAAQYPLLGMAVMPESSRKSVEETALAAIKILLDHRKVHNWVYLAVFLTIVQYAKNWERTESSGFWAYICSDRRSL